MNLFYTFVLCATLLLVKRSVAIFDKQLEIETENNLPPATYCYIVNLRCNGWRKQDPVYRSKSVLLYLCSLLLAESYAPEPNPGPRTPKFPCGICKKACKWTTPCVCCDSCDVWFHQDCLNMPNEIFTALCDISWECANCGIPNFSSGLFDTTLFESTEHSIQSNQGSDVSFGSPTATSSPKTQAPEDYTRTIPQSQRKDLPLRVLIINCQSIKTPGKKGSLENMVTTSNANIVIGNESWLDGSINSNEVFPEGFKAYRKDRNKNGGGVFILASHNLESREMELPEGINAEMLWIHVKIKGAKDLYIGSFYRPPSKTEPTYLEEIRTVMREIPATAHIWLAGDFNLGDVDWNHSTPKPQASNPTQCNQILEIASEFFLEQVVSLPTRVTEYTSAILDLFFTNNATLVNKCNVIPGIGDHEAVFVETSLRPMIQKKTPRKVNIYRKANFEAMKEGMNSKYEEFRRTAPETDINSLWQKFVNILKEEMQQHIPTKMISGKKNTKPWITRHIKSLHRRLRKLYERQKKSKCPRDRQKYVEARSETQKLERQEYWKHIEGILDDNKDEENEIRPTKHKKFWKYVKALKKDTCGVAPLKDNGRTYSDPIDKANILNRQYESVFTRENTRNIPNVTGRPSPPMPKIDIDNAGVCKLLRQLNPQKASGPDLLSSRILKDLSTECAPFLTLIFRRCLETGEIPDIWKTATVTAIFKKGERYKASNYRPVSLTCICCKTFEHILVSMIMKHLEKHKILTDTQHGFRARRSCETQLLTLVDELAKGLDKRKQLDLAVLDFSKAFDRVPHERLLRKLDHYGIRGKTLSCIRSFLSGRSQRVVVDGATSEAVPVVSGVPQGSVLGPILFLLFINDLPKCVKSKVRLFADDCIVYRQIDNVSDAKLLQEDLKHLAAWEKKWGMDFHPEKCSVLRVNRKRTSINYTYYLKGHALKLDDRTKYLGIELSNDLQWNHHIDKIVKKGNSTLGFLRRNLRTNKEELKCTAYKSLVRPHLEYCMTVWNPHQKTQIDKIEMVQRRAARYITGRYHNTSSVNDMIGHLKLETLEERRTKAQLLMVYKIIYDHVDIPSKDYYTITKSRTRAKHDKKIRLILASTDIYKYSFFPRCINMWNNLSLSCIKKDLIGFRKEIASVKF